ncbi:hypothetical protein COOONC_20478, partial [Cooperia oncophora]
MLFKSFFERQLAAAFSVSGRWIGRHPGIAMTLCMVTCTVFSVGFVRFEEVNSIRTDYSPMNSASRREYAVAQAFLNQNGSLDPAYVMVTATDGGSLLRETYRHHLIELAKTLQDNVTAEVNGRVFEYRDLCEPYCDMNAAFLAFLKLYDPEIPSTHTYPQVDIFGTQAFIGECYKN